MAFKLQLTKHYTFNRILLYCPPGTCAAFLPNLSQLLDLKVDSSGFTILGELQLHLENPENKDTAIHGHADESRIRAVG